LKSSPVRNSIWCGPVMWFIASLALQVATQPARVWARGTLSRRPMGREKNRGKFRSDQFGFYLFTQHLLDSMSNFVVKKTEKS
jgi:hypothetical protein